MEGIGGVQPRRYWLWISARQLQGHGLQPGQGNAGIGS